MKNSAMKFACSILIVGVAGQLHAGICCSYEKIDGDHAVNLSQPITVVSEFPLLTHSDENDAKSADHSEDDSLTVFVSRSSNDHATRDNRVHNDQTDDQTDGHDSAGASSVGVGHGSFQFSISSLNQNTQRMTNFVPPLRRPRTLMKRVQSNSDGAGGGGGSSSGVTSFIGGGNSLAAARRSSDPNRPFATSTKFGLPVGGVGSGPRNNQPGSGVLSGPGSSNPGHSGTGPVAAVPGSPPASAVPEPNSIVLWSALGFAILAATRKRSNER